MRAHVAPVLVVVGLLLYGLQADAYLKLGTRIGDRIVSLKWNNFPIRYFVSERSVPPGVSAPQLRDAVGRAFASWEGIANVSMSSQFVGFTQASPLDDDNISVIGFASRPDMERVLGSTSFTMDTVTGEIIESDIFFNSSFAWSVAPNGQPGAYDLETIAVHEIGHMHGLGHSALGETEARAGGRTVIAAEAIMFPIAFAAGSVNDRTPRADDIAGMSDLYGTSTFRETTGSMSGRVTKNGAGVPGAHVIAFNPASGHLVAGFTLSNDGTFVIAGLEPGLQIVRVEPLDDADVDSFFDASFTVDTNFKPAFSTRLVSVPRGGTAMNVEVKVVPK